MFRTIPLYIIRSFSLYTQQWCMSYRFADSKLLANLYVLLCVQWKTPDDGQRNCPKHVEFYSKNKFEKLVHLVGFIVRIYHDARTHERQILRASSTLFRYVPAKLHSVTHWTCKLSFHYLENFRYERERIRKEVAKSYSEILTQCMPGWTEGSDKMPPLFKGRETESVGTSHCLIC